MFMLEKDLGHLTGRGKTSADLGGAGVTAPAAAATQPDVRNQS